MSEYQQNISGEKEGASNIAKNTVRLAAITLAAHSVLTACLPQDNPEKVEEEPTPLVETYIPEEEGEISGASVKQEDDIVEEVIEDPTATAEPTPTPTEEPTPTVEPTKIVEVDYGVFNEIIEEDPMLTSVIELQGVLNSYDPSNLDKSMGEYFQESEFYKKLINEQKKGIAEKVFKYLEENVEKGEKFTDIELMNVCRSLFPELGIVPIGNYTTVRELLENADPEMNIYEIVVGDFFTSNHVGAVYSKHGGIIMIGDIWWLGSYQQGDLPVMVGNGFRDEGQIGIVLYSTEIDSQYFLLFIDTDEDGKIRIDQVDKENGNEVFGKRLRIMFGKSRNVDELNYWQNQELLKQDSNSNNIEDDAVSSFKKATDGKRVDSGSWDNI